jgi:hypothetical protein
MPAEEAVVPHPLAARELKGRLEGMVNAVEAITSSDKVEIMACRRGCQSSDAFA